MPAPQRTAAESPPAAPKKAFEPTLEEEEGEGENVDENVGQTKAVGGSDLRHKSNGTMDRNFKFPSTPPESPPVPPLPTTSPPATQLSFRASGKAATLALESEPEGGPTPDSIITPSSVEVPPPPPVEKERGVAGDDAEEEIGETVEIDLR
jgi:hypothetical protein